MTSERFMDTILQPAGFMRKPVPAGVLFDFDLFRPFYRLFFRQLGKVNRQDAVFYRSRYFLFVDIVGENHCLLEFAV